MRDRGGPGAGLVFLDSGFGVRWFRGATGGDGDLDVAECAAPVACGRFSVAIRASDGLEVGADWYLFFHEFGFFLCFLDCFHFFLCVGQP